MIFWSIEWRIIIQQTKFLQVPKQYHTASKLTLKNISKLSQYTLKYCRERQEIMQIFQGVL